MGTLSLPPKALGGHSIFFHVYLVLSLIMATSIEDNALSDAIENDYDPPEPPIPPDPPDKVYVDTSIQPSPLMTTLEPVNEPSQENRPQNNSKILISNLKELNILHIEDIPLKSNYETIDKIFRRFGNIKEIRMDIKSNCWEAWISFSSHKAAFEASKNIKDIKIRECNIKGALCDKAPKNLDIYKPDEWGENSKKSM